MQIVPTDLNSYLFDMERNIADFAIVLGDAGNATRFSALAAQRREAIQALMWDGSTGAETWLCHFSHVSWPAVMPQVLPGNATWHALPACRASIILPATLSAVRCQHES